MLKTLKHPGNARGLKKQQRTMDIYMRSSRVDPNDLAAKASEDGKTFTVELEAPPCPISMISALSPLSSPVPHGGKSKMLEGYMKDGKIENPGAWALEAGFVSNGAYNLVEWKHKESMVYQKNPNYHPS